MGAPSNGLTSDEARRRLPRLELLRQGNARCRAVCEYPRAHSHNRLSSAPAP